MKVGDLIRLLEDQDPDAEVLLMTQRNWPFENSVFGVPVREDVATDEEDGDDDEGEREPPRVENGTAPNDVFIVEGEQLRYGSKRAWDVATR